MCASLSLLKTTAHSGRHIFSAFEALDGERAELTRKPCHLFVKSYLQVVRSRALRRFALAGAEIEGHMQGHAEALATVRKGARGQIL